MTLSKDISTLLIKLSNMCQVGTNLLDLERAASEFLKENELTGCNVGYKQAGTLTPFPSVLCLSVNNVIAHGEPFDYVLRDGDTVNIDTSISDGEECADAAITVGVGNVQPKYQRLMRYAKQTTLHAIENMKLGMSTEELAIIIQRYAFDRGYNIVRRFSGHKIGKKVHEAPAIYNTTEKSFEYEPLTEGIYCIEPILTISRDNIGLPDSNGWNVTTMDGERSAYFEHMVRLTKDGAEILTTHF